MSVTPSIPSYPTTAGKTLSSDNSEDEELMNFFENLDSEDILLEKMKKKNDVLNAQQFHDFQQQLYATNTRSSQMRGSAGPGGGPMGPGPGGPMSMGPGMPPVSQGNFYAGPPGSGPMPSSAK